MTSRNIIIALACTALFSACKKEAGLTARFAPKFEGKEVVLATYGDSVQLASGIISNGTAAFDYNQLSDVEMPCLAQLMIDGRTRGIIIIEPGKAILDTAYNVSGTPLNNRLQALMAKADSIENVDDGLAYVKFIEAAYNDNSQTPIGEFFGTELIRNLEAAQIDSLLEKGPASLRNSKRVARYRKAAEIRKATAPGSKYIDFSATQPDGSTLSLSKYVGNGKWTLVDFWASWCPYCIKELPELKVLEKKYADKLQIVGVAVRDEASDTKTAIDKYSITWPVIYNAARIPYEIYGFTGIPHLMLISPDGTIVSRGESPSAIGARLEKDIK